MKKRYVIFLIILIQLNALADQLTEDSKNIDTEEDDCDGDESSESSKIVDFVGTNLFGDEGNVKKCFSPEDVALLTARKDFEHLIPKYLPESLMDDQLIEILMQYFYGANQVICKMSNGNAKMLAQKAFYDCLGGYLRRYLIPVTKYSFYAGTVSLRTAINIMQLYEQCKTILNTNGNGWRPPIEDFSNFDLTIEPFRDIQDSDCDDEVPCLNLNLSEEGCDGVEDILVSLPKLEPPENGVLSGIWLPFKRKHNFNLQLQSSAYILLRYYILVTRCHKYQGLDVEDFNTKFKNWFQENVEVHLLDDVLYPGFGAVLRIMETVKHRKKYVPVKPIIQEDTKTFTERKATQHYRKLKNKADKYPDIIASNNLLYKDLRPPKDDDDDDEDDDENSNEHKSKTYMYLLFAIFAIVAILLFIAIAVICIRCIRKKMGKNNGIWKNSKNGKKNSPESGENVELTKDSPSVVSGSKQKNNSSDDKEENEAPSAPPENSRNQKLSTQSANIKQTPYSLSISESMSSRTSSPDSQIKITEKPFKFPRPIAKMKTTNDKKFSISKKNKDSSLDKKTLAVMKHRYVKGANTGGV